MEDNNKISPIPIPVYSEDGKLISPGFSSPTETKKSIDTLYMKHVEMSLQQEKKEENLLKKNNKVYFHF